MASKRELKVVILGDDKSGTAMNAAGGHADGLSGKFSKLAKVAAAAFAAVAVGVAAFAVQGVRDAVELDTKLREVNTLFGVTGAAAEKNFGDISRVVREVSADVGVAQKTVAEGLYNAISAGVPKENAFEFMKTASKAAIAGVTDTNTAVQGLTGIINAFGLKAGDASKVADSMFTTVKGGITTFPELAANISTIAPAAAAAGVSFQEVGAALATLTSNKVPTAQAATQLRAALAGLQRPSKELDTIFRAVGFSSAQAAIEQKGLGFALDTVKDASDGNNGKLQQLLGSVEAVSAANIIAGTGAEKFAQELKSQQTAAGATDMAFAEMEQSIGRQWERLKVQVQNLGIEVGSRALPLITTAMAGLSSFVTDRVIPAFESLSAWWTAHGPVIMAVAAAVGAAMLAGFQTARDAVASVSDYLQEHSTVATAVGVAIAAVAAVVAAAWVAQAGVATAQALRSVAAWFTTATASTTSSTIQSRSTAQIVVGWLAHSAAALGQAARVVAGWLMTSAGAIASGVVMAAQAALHVAKWVLMGAQAMVNAAIIAAAWLIALGPVGLVIAGVAAVIAIFTVAWKTSETFRDIVTGAMGVVQRAAGDAVGFLVQGFRGLLTVWLAVAGGIVSGAATALGWIPGVGGKLKQAEAAFNTMKGNILGTLDGIANQAHGFGEDVGRGLVNGMNAQYSAVVRASQRLAEAAATPMRKGLQVASPSKLTTYYGEMVGEGLVVGMESSRSTVARAAGDLADLLGMQVGGTGYVMGRLGSAPASSAAAPRPVVGTSPAPTSGPDQLGRFVDAVERMEASIADLKVAVRRQTERQEELALKGVVGG